MSAVQLPPRMGDTAHFVVPVERALVYPVA